MNDLFKIEKFDSKLILYRIIYNGSPDKFLSDFNDNNFDDYIDQLSDLVFTRIVDKYGDIYPLNFTDNKEEILIGELARLNTVLAMLEDKQEYEKCVIVKNRIRNIENILKKGDLS